MKIRTNTGYGNTGSTAQQTNGIFSVRYQTKTSLIIIEAGFVLFLLVMFSSCKKFIQVDAPVNNTNAENVYSNDATAAAVLTGIYSQMSDWDYDLANNSGLTSITVFTALSGDELTLFDLNNFNLLPYYRNDLSEQTNSGFFWSTTYTLLFSINSAIEGLNKSKALSPAVKEQLIGEAKFLRAFCYFYLVNLYGEVPLVLTTDWKTSSSITRSPVANVYDQIELDLEDASELLNAKYVNSDARTPYNAGAEERVRPTKWAASALLSRVYLYREKFAKAEEEATKVINNSGLFGLTDVGSVFRKNSRESVWQLQPVRTGENSNTAEGALFVLPTEGPNGSDYPVILNKSLVDKMEPGDLRTTNWIDSVKPDNIAYYYANKYSIGKVSTNTQEYVTVLRLAEQFLIRSEARSRQNNIEGAKSDLNSIRSRAGLANTTAGDQASLLAAIKKERVCELFVEWGHRWFDLKRYKDIDAVMLVESQRKGGTWSPYKSLFPIRRSEMNTNPNLFQNEGY